MRKNSIKSTIKKVITWHENKLIAKNITIFIKKDPKNFLIISFVLIFNSQFSAVAGEVKGKQHRNSDMIDLVGLPPLALPQAVESIKLPKRGIATIINPPRPARSAIDPHHENDHPAATIVTMPALPVRPTADQPVASRITSAATRPLIAPIVKAAEHQPKHPSPAVELYASIPDVLPPMRLPVAPMTASPLETLFKAAQAPTPPVIERAPQAARPEMRPDFAPPHPAPGIAATPIPDPVTTGTINQARPPHAAEPPAAMLADARPPGWVDEDLGDEAFQPAPRTAASPRRTTSKEWELPRARRATGRPALNAAIAPAESGLPSTRINYIVRSQPLDQILREIGQMVSTRIVPGQGVRATIHERRLEGPANAVLDRLAREFGLFWFSDGGMVFVDPIEDSKTKLFRVRNASAGAIDSTLASTGLAKHRDRIQIVGNDGLVRVTGPDSFLKAVETTLTGIETDKTSVQIIKFGQKAN